VKILGLDFETTGLSAEKNEIIEVGAVLFDFELKKPLEMYSTFVLGKIGFSPKISDEIFRITGITESMVTNNGVSLAEVRIRLQQMESRAEFFMAHNAEFDRGFYNTHIYQSRKPWLCTKNDIDYPAHFKGRSLIHVSAEHGFINPFQHRAVFDVMSMLRVASEYDIKEIVQSSLSPMVILRAMVTYENKDLARARGYQWDSSLKEWRKMVKQFKVHKEISEAPFQTVIVG
jgi:DNA polymerase-3 subunit epsilon